MLSEFLDFLYGDLRGNVYSPVKKKSGEFVPAFFLWPQQKQQIIQHIESQKSSGDVYIAPALFKGRKPIKDYVIGSQVLWVDIDAGAEFNGDFKDLPLPNVVVQSSTKDRVHCYWKLTEQIQVKELEDLNRRLARHLNADNSGWDAPQVLRPPETFNYKRDLPVGLVRFEPLPVDKQFAWNLQEVPHSEPNYELLELDPVDVLSAITVSPDLLKRITEETTTGDRSSFLFSSACLMAEEGLDVNQITALLQMIDDRVGKFKFRDDRLQQLTHCAVTAWNKIQDSGASSETPPAKKAIQLYQPLDVVNLQEELDFIVDGWLHRTGILIIAGSPGVGKTQASMQLGYCLSTGEDFLGRKVKPVKKVLFMSLEMMALELKYIFQHQMNHYQSNLDDWNNALAIYSPDEGYEAEIFEAIVEQLKPDVIIIDSLSELFEDEMKEGEAKKVMRFLAKLRNYYNCAIILIHHNRKANDTNKKPTKLSDLYGSFIFAKTVETVITLWKDDKGKMELITNKARFGREGAVSIVRNEHLIFSVTEGSNDSNQIQGTPGAIPSFLDFS